ncbi:DNA polymerase III subunit delta [Thermodesulfovibrio yellowstonii]|uniref:DNA polymerase III subunit delta n=1 Tax=Thermodesulfovibrio yellowstonii TaxID=28262 RepID=A0A9W6GED6_9BACT|nr:DNA polymerase III subunit delta [Thermodesulfovibrio islandicus]GLI53769.1 DNA polymerase III subunit delta [Thermodesulfovibrio islandicus]
MLEIEKLEQEIKEKLPKRMYFCYAQDTFLLFEVTRLVRKNFDPVVIETYESPEELDITSFASPSLFSSKTVLLIYNFEKIKKTEKRIEWLKKITSQVHSSISLILLCNASYKEISDEIAYLKKDKNSLLYNLDLKKEDLPTWIAYKASQNGITLKQDAIYYLIDITGGQPGLISSEIEKISLLTDKSHIGLFDIKDILTELGEFTAFDLIDAIKKKDKERAYRLIDKLQNTEPDMILGALNWYYTNRVNADPSVYNLLYRTNLSLRQARSCSLEMLLYELLKN